VTVPRNILCGGVAWLTLALAVHAQGPPALFGDWRPRVGYLWDARSGTDGTGSPTFEHAEFRVRAAAPLYMSSELRLFGGLRLSRHALCFEDTTLKDQTVYVIAAPLIASVPLSRGWSFFGMLAPSLATDFEGVSVEAFRASAFGFVRGRLSRAWAVSVGGVYLQTLGRSRVFPGIGFDWRPSDAWSAHLAFPRSMLSYCPSKRWCVFGELSPAGGQWHVAEAPGPDAGDADISLRGFRSGLGAEYAPVPRVRLRVRAGAVWGREYTVERSGMPTEETGIDDSWYVGVSLAWRPRPRR